VEFQREGFNLFETMMERIREETLEFIFRLKALPRVEEPAPRVMVAEKPEADGSNGQAAKSAPLITTAHLPGGLVPRAGGSAPAAPAALKKIGRNDPCPCGSGKKYKKCCGK
jgi:preprotein translocase subunit SecA